LKESLLGD